MSQVLLIKKHRLCVFVGYHFLFVLLFSLPGASARSTPTTDTKGCKTLTWNQTLELAEQGTDDARACLVKFLSHADPQKWESKLAQVFVEEWAGILSPGLATPRLLDESPLPEVGLKGGWVYFHVSVDEKGFPIAGCINGESIAEEDLKVLAALLKSRYRPARAGLKFVRGTFTLVIMRCR